MNQKPAVFYREMESPIGTMTLVSTEKGMAKVVFGNVDDTFPELKAWTKKHHLSYDLQENDSLFIPVITQLTEYFQGKRQQFTINFDLYGTAFQQKTWQTLRTIPYGETRSYKEIAQCIGAPKAVRAIGQANNQNPVPILIPCHRVVGSNGALVGYNGGIDKKVYLLQLEKENITEKTS